MRKSSVLTNLLLAGVLLGAVANVAIFARYVQVLNAAQRLQGQAQQAQNRATAVNRHFAVARAMTAEAMQFAQQHPKFEPILRPYAPLLQRMELMQRPSNPTQPAP